MIHRGEKGFTLIELLVVIAILGVIAAIVALNVAGFFGRGTLQAARTELHQAQTAIISAMADAESNSIEVTLLSGHAGWRGDAGVVIVDGPRGPKDAADYIYGPFRAEYKVTSFAAEPTNPGAIVAGDPDIPGGWGDSIAWDYCSMGWANPDDILEGCDTP